MKKILSFVLILMMIIIVGCKDGIKNNNIGGQQIVPTPNLPSLENLKEDDILKAFAIKKGEITASAAAKKIKSTALAPTSQIVLTEIKIIFYDDESGEFKIQFKGTRKGGSSFDNTITFTHFMHPLIGKAIQSLNGIELSFDEAIENNYSLDKYIKKLNESIKEKKMLKGLSFMLNDSFTIIELGEHDKYTLTASAEKSETKLRLKPQVVYLKLLENETTETEKPIPDFSFNHLKTELTKEYFVATDVFKYVLNKVDYSSVIKENKNEFASSFYVVAKETEKASDDIFSDEFKAYIKKYHDIYEQKSEDEHLKLNVTYGVYDPKNGGVDADDYIGSLKINLCVATSEQIADQNGIVATKNIEKVGAFASIPDDAALAKKEHLFFNFVPKVSLTNEMKKAWENKEFDNYALLKTNGDGNTTVSNPFTANSIPFHLCVNSSETNLSHLGLEMYGASRTMNEKIIFIERIRLEKSKGSKSMDVFVTLKGSNSNELKTTVEPIY